MFLFDKDCGVSIQQFKNDSKLKCLNQQIYTLLCFIASF